MASKRISDGQAIWDAVGRVGVPMLPTARTYAEAGKRVKAVLQRRGWKSPGAWRKALAFARDVGRKADVMRDRLAEADQMRGHLNDLLVALDGLKEKGRDGDLACFHSVGSQGMQPLEQAYRAFDGFTRTKAEGQP